MEISIIVVGNRFSKISEMNDRKILEYFLIFSVTSKGFKKVAEIHKPQANTRILGRGIQ